MMKGNTNTIRQLQPDVNGFRTLTRIHEHDFVGPPFCVGEGFIDDVAAAVVVVVTVGSFVVVLAISSASIVVVVVAPAAGMNSDSCSCFSASFWIRSFTYSAS